MNFLAVDIGGSKTKAVVFDSDMNTLKCFETIGFGVASDFCEDIDKLGLLFFEIKKEFEICSVAVNLGGKNKEQIFNLTKESFKNSKVLVFRESEGAAAVAFGKNYGAGAVLLAGTGTIAVAYDESDNFIIGGGWGMNIGDGGSGYYIGLEAIKRSLLALDKNKELTPMQKEITGLDEAIKHHKNTSEICRIRDEVRGRIFPLERRRVASFAKIVTKYCQNGEEDALSIMRDAGGEMALVTYEAVNKLLPFEVKKVCVSGGLTNSLKFWQAEFEKTVMENSSVKEFIYENDGVLLGTKLLAIEQTKKEEE